MICKEILTREEVMDILKIGRSTFYKLLQTGELKGFKEGNRYKVPAESIEEYINSRMKIWAKGRPKALYLAFGFSVCHYPYRCCEVYLNEIILFRIDNAPPYELIWKINEK